MESQTSRWSGPSLARNKTAVIALAALALGCSLYYVHDQIWSSPPNRKPTTPGLHRSNARRQRRLGRSESSPPVANPANQITSRYTIDEPWGSTPIDLGFLHNPATSDEVLAHHVTNILSRERGQITHIALTRHLPSVEELHELIDNAEDATLVRHELEEAFLGLFFFRHLSPSDITPEQQEVIIHELEADGGFSPETILSAITYHQSRQLSHMLDQWGISQRSRSDEARNAGYVAVLMRPPRNSAASEALLVEGNGSVTDEESEHSWRGDREAEDENGASKEGSSLLALLYRIAEEQARKDGYVHRRVTCNACNTMPIRGIRYHCSNCPDFDLCEQCETMQEHPKTHVFYKIRIPAPFVRYPKEPEPVWYPGKPVTVNHALARDITAGICKRTGLQNAEVEALWEQFRCFAATEWPDDPDNYGLAIDRQTFDKCFLPQTSLRPPPPNLIYDRMFAFYDQNSDGLIGFQEFVDGLASLTRKKADERQKRVFRGYDINNDGLVDRKDFLRMFRAYYALTKELTRDVIVGMEDDVSDSGARDIILGSQPISSAFNGTIPPPERSRSGVGKMRDNFGDLAIFDNKSVIDEHDHDLANLYETIGEKIEIDQNQDLRIESIRDIYSASWPPRGVIMADVEKVLTQAIPTAEVTAVSDQRDIRRAAHARLAREYQRCSSIRRIAVRDRDNRRAFYIDDEDGTAPARVSALKSYAEEAVSPSERTLSKSLRILKEARQGDPFLSSLREKIEEMRWPLHDSSMLLARDIADLIMHGWSCLAIAQDLQGYAADANFRETAEFVKFIVELLERLVGNLDSETPSQGPLRSHPLARRSRSSSKVRFQDDVEIDDAYQSRSRATSTSSRSIPINERWGGIEVPEPEKDVGREVLYQFTQEALNELLDPIFSLREDLALAVFRTKRVRERFRAEAAASVENPIAIKGALVLYQQRWRMEPACGIGPAQRGTSLWDEAAPLSEFLRMREQGIKGNLTAEQCPRCSQKGKLEWINLGDCCDGCSRPSNFKFTGIAGGRPIPEERCPYCADKGEISTIGGSSGGFWCTKCGQASTFYEAENARLLRIISGGDPPAKASMLTSKIEDELVAAVTASGRPRATQAPQNALDINSPGDLFDRTDPSKSEESIAQKPLDDLLADSGYTIADTPRGPSPPPDPTLPQNRPNDPILDSSSRLESQALGSSPQVDPTLPQNRPNSLPRPDHISINSPPDTRPQSSSRSNAIQESPPDKDTLRYYAALNLIEHEDKERGGPGRLNFEEFEEVMKGEKGKALGFLGTWVEMASF